MQFCKKIQFGLTEPHKEVQHEKFRSNQGHQGPPKRSPQNRQENRSQADGIPDKRKKNNWGHAGSMGALWDKLIETETFTDFLK